MQDVIDSIPKLVANKNVADLQSLRDHGDKAVRKAARKGLHVLASHGIDVDKAPGTVWSTGDAIASLRGDLEPTATVDALASPGALRFVLSVADSRDGARLFAGALSPSDRILDFSAYRQTDGQRARLLRDWNRRHQDREVPVPWICARILWARERTLEGGFSVPSALNQSLSLLGETPRERPASFLAPLLANKASFDAKKIDEILLALRVQGWPLLCDMDSVLEKAAEIHGDKPQPSTEEERAALIRRATDGDEAIRAGLSGPIAHALDDAAVGAWLSGDMEIAGAAVSMSVALRESAEAEKLAWAPRIVGFQVASLLRAVGGPEAVERARQEAEKQQEA